MRVKLPQRIMTGSSSGSKKGINITITRDSESTGSNKKIGYRPINSTSGYTYFDITQGTITEYLEGYYELAIEAYLNGNFDESYFYVYCNGVSMSKTMFDYDDVGGYYRSVIEIHDGVDCTINYKSTYTSTTQTERVDITIAET